MDEREIPEEWHVEKKALKDKYRKVWTSFGAGRILLSFLENLE